MIVITRLDFFLQRPVFRPGIPFPATHVGLVSFRLALRIAFPPRRHIVDYTGMNVTNTVSEDFPN